MRVYSKPNYGTTFILCIKTNIVESPANENDSNIRPDSGGSSNNNGSQFSKDKKDQISNPVKTPIRAMIIDDNPYNSELNKKYLEKNGIKVLAITRNGQDTLDKYVAAHDAKEAFHLLVVDLDMTLLDGISVIEKIRQFEEDKKAF